MYIYFGGYSDSDHYDFQDFLALDEFDSTSSLNGIHADTKIKNNLSDKEKKMENENLKPGVLTLSNINASWKLDSSVDNLKHITLTAMPGEFIGVAGLVGSGKVNNETLCD